MANNWSVLVFFFLGGGHHALRFVSQLKGDKLTRNISRDMNLSNSIIRLTMNIFFFCFEFLLPSPIDSKRRSGIEQIKGQSTACVLEVCLKGRDEIATTVHSPPFQALAIFISLLDSQ